MAKKQKIGGSNLLCEVSILSEHFGISKNAATRMLKIMRIPIIYSSRVKYFNFHAFEKVLYYLSRHGGEGFVMPGSYTRNRYSKKYAEELGKLTITDEDMEKMSNPAFVAEFECAGTHRAKPGVVSAYIRELQEQRRRKDHGFFDLPPADGEKK